MRQSDSVTRNRPGPAVATYRPSEIRYRQGAHYRYGCVGTHGFSVARALEETGRAGRVVFIGHELTEHTRRFLLSGVMDAVIDQNPRREAREAVIALSRAARGLPVQNSDLTVGMQVIFRENIPLL